MYHLSCADGYAFVGLGDGDVFVLDVLELPSPNGSSGLVSISSDQTLSLFDLHRTLRAGPTRSVSLCHGNVTAMRLWDSSSTGSGQGSLVCTAGENGTAAVWDVRVPDAKAEVMRIAGRFEFRRRKRGDSMSSTVENGGRRGMLILGHAVQLAPIRRARIR